MREVPDEVNAALDANALRAGVTRAEYLAEKRGPVTRDHLVRFAERTADLGNPEVLAVAWK